MPSSHKTMLEYVYSHDQTLATTGYFSCTPAPPPAFGEGLFILASRPLDTFMHTHLLRQLMQGGPRAWAEALALLPEFATEKALTQAAKNSMTPLPEDAHAPLACLLLEAASLADYQDNNFAPILRRLEMLAKPFQCHTPLAPLLVEALTDEDTSWLAALGDNIQTHKPLPTNWTPLNHSSGENPVAEIKNNFSGIQLIRAERERLQNLPPVESQAADCRQTYATALERLEKAGILAGPEMRHEASLSPIALLREWRIQLAVCHGRAPYALTGTARAYGRGLSLAQARVSCAMEIVERASAYAGTIATGKGGAGAIALRAHETPLRVASASELQAAGYEILTPADTPSALSIQVHWLEGENAQGEPVFVPAQAVFLFLNLDEADLHASSGSTGLATAASVTEAKLAALLEILERDAHAVTPFDPRACFLPASRQPIIQALLDDYHARGIFPLFQEITTEFGVPVYRCFVTGRDGAIAQATCARLNGFSAALGALTETPWPYSWATPAPFGKASARPLAGIPVRILDDLPDMSLPSTQANLALLENVLARHGKTPIYVDITRADLGFPVIRAFIPGLQLDADFDPYNFSPEKLKSLRRRLRVNFAPA